MTVLNSSFAFIYRSASLENMMVIVFMLCILYYFLFCRDLPPGPWGIPILGYWPFLKSEEIHLHLKELREKYGEVFSITAAGKLFICLSSMKAIKEAKLDKSDCFEERFSGYSLLTISFKEGLAIINGDSWRVLRKFFIQKFKEYGMLAIKQDISGSLYNTLKETLNEMSAMQGQPIAITDLLAVKCSHAIRRILFNDQGISQEELKELNHEYGSVLQSQTSKNLMLMGNIARYFVFPFMPSYWAMLRSHNRIQVILNTIVQRHKLVFDENQAIDIIDSFYKEKEERKRKGDPSAKYFTDQSLISTVHQFVTDGVLFVSFFISLVIQHLMEYPSEQDKIYDELLEVIGPDRQPTIEDKSNLPYTNAYIYEVIRYSGFFPLIPSLQCTKETTLSGYRIPKGATLLMNTWCAHHDPNAYEDPFTFNPSRFITTPGKQRPDLPVLFGIGKRACIGEPYTMIQTFLFLTTIIKNFRLTRPDGVENLSKTLDEVDVKICAIPRIQEVEK